MKHCNRHSEPPPRKARLRAGTFRRSHTGAATLVTLIALVTGSSLPQQGTGATTKALPHPVDTPTQVEGEHEAAEARPRPDPPEEEGDGRPGELCAVCGTPAGANGVSVLHRGRRVALHRDPCRERWNDEPGLFFASFQPRGALFQEPAEPPSPLKGAWFLFGAYIVAGLIAGAMSAYIAVGRGLPPIPWFFAGLVLNVIALGLVLTRRSADLARFPAGVPRGLAKVPTTRAPSRCASCGGANHPAARACAACGARLDPTVEAETMRTAASHGPGEKS